MDRVDGPKREGGRKGSGEEREHDEISFNELSFLFHHLSTSGRACTHALVGPLLLLSAKETAPDLAAVPLVDLESWDGVEEGGRTVGAGSSFSTRSATKGRS